MPGDALWFLLLGGGICALGALGGVHAERRRLQFVIHDQAARNSEQSRRLTETEKLLSEAQAGNEALSTFLVVLPDVARRLSTHVSKRSIPPLLASTLEHLFDPGLIMIYLTGANGELVLVHGKGLPEGVARGQRLRFGEGQIGLAATHQMAMDRDDFHSDSMFRRSQIDETGLTLDLIAPMVYERRTLGVLCVGAAAKSHRDDKKMIKLVADLGSLSLNNHEMIQSLENVANRDSLTSLCTKRVLSMRLGELIHSAGQTHSPLSVIMLDIDHFKRYNDTFGHLAGDEILKTVARILRSQLRSDDIPTRYGGEEFAVVLPGTSKEDALRIAEKIRRAVELHPFPQGVGSSASPGTVTLSGGVAALFVDGTSSQEILGAADQALYVAKQQGRNRIVEHVSKDLSDDSGETEAVALGDRLQDIG